MQELVGGMLEASDVAALSAAIGLLYDAAIDPARWPLALEKVCGFVGGAQATLFWQGPSARAVGVFHHYNDDPFYTDLYLEKLAPLNPFFPAAFFHEVGLVHTASDLVPDEELRETVFHREWIAPQGFTDALSVLLARDATQVAILSFPWRDGAIDAAARRRLALLVPHLRRAVAIGQLFAERTGTLRALASALDHLEAGVFLVAKTGRVVVANGRGRRLVEAACPLRLSDGALRLAEPKADQALRHGLRALATADAAPDVRGFTLELGQASDQGWTVHVLPLSGETLREGGASEAVAAVFVRDAQAAPPLPIEPIARRYGLTAGEIRVAEAVLRVSGLEALAGALGISRATVKTHLNRIYRKCGVTRQSELIKLVAGLGREG